MIIVIPDNDMVKGSIDEMYDYGASEICHTISSWLVHEVNKNVSSRKEAMKKIRKGSVMRGEPKLVYVKMIYRPGRDEVQSLRNHFNIALENCLTKVSNHYIVDINVRYTGFDITNYLTATDKEDYWTLLDQQLQKLDENPDDFKPIPQEEIPKPQSGNETRYRMPPPPPLSRETTSNGNRPHHHQKHGKH